MPSKPVRFHEEASSEYDAAFDWYLERSADAASDFDAGLDRALTDIASAPQRWAQGTHSTRRYLLQRFPYVLVYRELKDHIQIVAVAHTSRRPGYWKTRVKQ